MIKESDKQKYLEIETLCKIIISHLPTLTKAEECGILSSVAKQIQKHPYRSVLFAMWKSKPYEEIIWKMIKPKYQQPFKENG